MADDAGGPEVARVSVRVVPKLKGFRKDLRKKVEKHTKGVKARVPVEADTKGLTRQVKKGAAKAAQSASGSKVRFGVDLDSGRLSALARLAAKAASVHKVRFGAVMDNAAVKRAISGIGKISDALRKNRAFGAIRVIVGTIGDEIRNKWNMALVQTHQVTSSLRRGFGRLMQPLSRGVKRLGQDMKDIGSELGWLGGAIGKKLAGSRIGQGISKELGLIKADFKNLGWLAGQAGKGISKMVSESKAFRFLSRETSRIKEDFKNIGWLAGQAGKGIGVLNQKAKELTRSKLDAGFDRIHRSVDRIRNSDVWSKFAQGAVAAAKRVAAIRFAPKVSGDSDGIDGAERSMRRLSDTTKRSDGVMSKFLRKIPLIGRAFGEAGNKTEGFLSKLRSKYFQPDNNVGFLAVAITALLAPAIGLVGSLMAGLPTLLAGVGAAAAVVALGFEGIKDAVKPLGDALEPLKESLSETFRQNLTPQFDKLAAVVPQLEGGFQRIAKGLTDMSGAAIDVVTMPESIAVLNRLAERTGDMFSSMSAGVGDFTAGLLTMFDGASEGFVHISDEFNKFASTFRQDMATLVDTGAMQAAMESLGSVVGTAFSEIHRIMVAGIEVMPQMTEGINSLFTGIGDLLVGAMPLLATFSNSLFTVIGELGTHLGSIFEKIGPGLSQALEAVTTVITGVFDAIGPALGDVLGSLAGVIGTLFSSLASAIQPLLPIIQSVAETIGSALTGAFEALTPVIPVVAQALGQVAEVIGGALAAAIPVVAPLVATIAEAFAQILTAVAPVVPIIANLAGQILGALLPVFEALVGAIGPVIEAFATGLTAALEALMPMLPPLAEAVAMLAESLGAALAEAIAVIAPYLPMLVTAFMQLLTAVVPLIPVLLQLVLAVLPPLIDIITALLPVLEPVIAVVMLVVNVFVALVAAIMPVIVVLAQVITAFVQVVAVVVSAGAQILGAVIGWVSGVISAVVNFVSNFISTMVTWWQNTVTTIQNGVSQATTTVAQLPGKVRAALGNLGSLLVSSGKALIQGFINGIKSMIGAAVSAARSVVSAVRDLFPFSPAKEGPFSGRGYTTYSGKALIRDFADSMSGERNYATNAAGGVLEGVQREFERYQKNLDNMHRDEVLQPVLEANAQKIADFRKKEAEAMEKGNADMAKLAEDRNKMLESLEVPDYRKINRSFQAYYIDGTKKMMQNAVLQSAKDNHFAAQIRQVSLDAVAEARRVFGDHPVMAQVEANVSAEHFARSIQEAIEKAELGHVPIDFAISNLDQLKSDLGFGDGALTKAIEAAMEFNPNDTDAYRYEKESKQEVHYHVADMQEAIRLEEERQRRGALRYI